MQSLSITLIYFVIFYQQIKLSHSADNDIQLLGLYEQKYVNIVITEATNPRPIEYLGDISTRQRCNRFTCSDPLQCQITETKKVLYYVYPHLTFLSSDGHVIYSSQSMITKEYSRLLNSILSSQRFTPDPERACLFIPRIDLTYFTPANNSILRSLYDHLPYWRAVDGAPGTNHLRISLDSGRSGQFIDLLDDNAIVIASNMNTWTYRRDFDFPIGDLVGERKGSEDFVIDKRKVKLLFTQYSSIGGRQKKFIDRLKQRLNHNMLVLGHDCNGTKVTVHNGRKLTGTKLNGCKPSSVTNLSHFEKTSCRCTQDDELKDYPFPQVLESSIYCLIMWPITPSNPNDDYVNKSNAKATTRIVPLGDSSHYLLSLAIKHSCIPILDSDIVMPYNQMINWPEISYSLMTQNIDEPLESSIESIADLVISEKQSELLDKQKKIHLIWSEYFESPEKIAHNMMDHFDYLVYPKILSV